MNRWKMALALCLALAVLSGCAGREGAPGEEAPAPSRSGTPASASQSWELEEGSLLPEDLVEREVPGAGASIRLPAEYAQEDSGQEGLLQLSTGDRIVMVAVTEKGAGGRREEILAGYQETMARQMGSEGIQQEPPQLPFGSDPYAVLYQGDLEGTAICNYGLFFSTDTKDVFFQVTGLAQGWDEELGRLLDCLSTYRED